MLKTQFVERDSSALGRDLISSNILHSTNKLVPIKATANMKRVPSRGVSTEPKAGGTSTINRPSKSKGNLLGQGTNNCNLAAENDYGLTPAKYRGFNGLTLDE